jgi:hypothetical protein
VPRHDNRSDTGGLINRLRGLFNRSDPEQERRRWLLERGRIIDGFVIDIMQQGKSVTDYDIDTSVPCTILYRYTTSSVTYESAQELSQTQLIRLQDYRVGMRVSVRYDPRRPVNSFVE